MMYTHYTPLQWDRLPMSLYSSWDQNVNDSAYLCIIWGLNISLQWLKTKCWGLSSQPVQQGKVTKGSAVADSGMSLWLDGVIEELTSLCIRLEQNIKSSWTHHCDKMVIPRTQHVSAVSGNGISMAQHTIATRWGYQGFNILLQFVGMNVEGSLCHCNNGLTEKMSRVQHIIARRWNHWGLNMFLQWLGTKCQRLGMFKCIKGFVFIFVSTPKIIL